MSFETENGVLKKYNEDPGVTEITVPGGVTIIGSKAFAGCSSLISVTIPDGVTIIEPWAFAECINLVSVTISGSVSSIGEWAFYRCSKLASAVIPDGVKSIEKFTFYGCCDLRSATIPNSVKRIKSGAFKNCGGLVSVNIPDSVTKIGCMAFEGCKNLISVSIPRKVRTIENAAFKDCPNLTDVNVDMNNPVYRDIDGILYDNGGQLVLCHSKEKNIIIPDGVLTVGYTSFCGSLTSAVIPESVNNICTYAFFCCKNLSEVIFEGGSAVLSDNAFHDCPAVKKIIFKKGIPQAAKKAFSGCTSLPAIVLLGNPIKDWKDRDCMKKHQAALGFMLEYINGCVFDDSIAAANLRWIKTQRRKLYDYILSYPECLKYMCDEKILDIDDIDALTEKSNGDSDILSTLEAYKAGLKKCGKQRQ